MKAAFTAVLATLASAGQAIAQAAPAPPPPTTVQSVVVTAHALPTQVLIDRKVYTVTTDLQASSGSAADILNNVPSVSVDADGAISLRGDGNVTILVDGKPSAQFSGAAKGLSLLQFPAADIDRVEVLTNPPAQYKAEGSGGVINIVTRKSRQDGVSGGAQASVGLGGRVVLGVNGAYNRGPLKLTAGLSLRRDIRERLTTDGRTVVDPVSRALVAGTQSTDEHFTRLIPQVKAGFDYELSSRQSFGGSFSNRQLTGVRFFDQHNTSGPPAGAATSVTDRHSDGHEWSVDAGQNLHFEQKLWRPSETLNLVFQRSVDRERERYVYTNTAAPPPLAAPTFDDLHLSHDLIKSEFSADYDLPLPRDRELRLGYDLEIDGNAFDNVGNTLDPITKAPTVNPAITNHFRYHQGVNAGYVQVQAPLGAWRLQAGIRVESADVSTLQITGNIPGARHDFGVYPSLSLDHRLGADGKLTASVSRRINRPDPEALNPFSDHQDIHNLRAGNPNLKPQDTWSFELGYSGAAGSLSYGATGYYRLDRNAVTDVLQPVGPDVVLATKANLPLTRSAGLEFSANGKLAAKLTYAVSGNLFYSQIDATLLGAPGLKFTTGVNLKTSLDYRPTAVDTAQISFTRQDRRLTPQGAIDAVSLVNIGYRRQLRPDLALVITLSDVLNGQTTRRLIDTPLLHDVYVRHQVGRVGYLGLAYTFGGQKKPKPGFEYDQ